MIYILNPCQEFECYKESHAGAGKRESLNSEKWERVFNLKTRKFQKSDNVVFSDHNTTILNIKWHII